MYHASPNLLIERDLENERVGGARQMVGRPKKNSLASSLLLLALASLSRSKSKSKSRIDI